MTSDHDGTSPTPVRSAVRDLLEAAKKLPYDERRALAETLWDSVESEVEARLPRTLGQDAGAFEVPEDFDEPLSNGPRSP